MKLLKLVFKVPDCNILGSLISLRIAKCQIWVLGPVTQVEMSFHFEYYDSFTFLGYMITVSYDFSLHQYSLIVHYRISLVVNPPMQLRDILFHQLELEYKPGNEPNPAARFGASVSNFILFISLKISYVICYPIIYPLTDR